MGGGGDIADDLIGSDLVQKPQQYGSIPHLLLVTSTARTPSVLLIAAYMYLAPDAALGAAMFTGVPLAFAFALIPVLSVARQANWQSQICRKGAQVLAAATVVHGQDAELASLSWFANKPLPGNGRTKRVGHKIQRPTLAGT
jgi:hypothetical protein